MQTISLADSLNIRASRTYGLEAPEVGGRPENNLVSRAYALARRWNPLLPWVHVALEKNIPQGAGLGGGSSDAAAILRWAEMVSGACLPEGAAASLGMDVPFLLRGGTAVASGYGERVSGVDPLPPWGVLLASAGIPAATAAVYRDFDRSGRAAPHLAQPDAVLRDLRAERLPRDLCNDLERSAQHVVPGLADFKRTLQEVSQLPWFLSGSGSVYYSLSMDPERLEHAAWALRSRGIPWLHAARFAEGGEKAVAGDGM